MDAFLRSAGQNELSHPAKGRLDRAVGVWVQELRVILINESHPALAGSNAQTLEAFIADVAWHEWGHALSVVRCSPEDVAAGRRLLELAPDGIRENIRRAGYRPQNFTHEVIAQTYALLMARRIRGHPEKPPWLDDEIYSLLVRATGWTT